ncbi:adenosine deaminase [Chroococcidiopsis thermalis]|jgi:adenosine deaminase|uniref:Adenosine deaminase n=1 Tax=Chroococcidiopsis thermalis (strain PCC 7203) TaxID=251229 RepID=K9U883_CHRTP|nr:adenosine deaminase [Chroococcidiopsis thermalis]AFY90454.1 adenosine deaminase [Chroococcidiopsis thermalis PCC 7203]PSB45629.1 adenosine deaminase [Cyanosarcina cf. burmensis CCALA 770]
MQHPATVSSVLAARLQAMPKAEIHVHIEGATDAETFYQLAQRHRVDLPANSLGEWKEYFEFRSFPHFIQVYTAAARCLQTPDDYKLIIERFFQRQSEQNIVYTEASLSASFLTQKFEDEAILDAIAAGLEAGQAQYGVRVNLIPDIAREIPDSQTRVLEFVLKGKERGLFIGLGVGGLEAGYPPELFTETFAQARQQGLRVVAHAGEVVGTRSIWGAVNSLQAERIGHGIRCLDDPQLVEVLRQRQIPLEVSPQSNYCLGVVGREQPHPIRQMVDAGLYCTVNSDDPAMFSTSLNNEYLTLASQGFSWEELWQFNLNTLAATFLSATEKAKYDAQWQAFLISTAM